MASYCVTTNNKKEFAKLIRDDVRSGRKRHHFVTSADHLLVKDS